MASLDDSTLSLNDNVFSVGYGRGRVVEILSEGRFIVQFEINGRRATFGSNGVQVRMPYRTLFWRDPVIAVPTKDDVRWNRLRPVIESMIQNLVRGVLA